MTLNKTVRTLSVVAISLAVAGGAVAAALPAADLQGKIAGAELRFSEGAFMPKYYLWRFSKNGSMYGVYQKTNTLAPRTTVFIEDADTGSWSIEGNTACFQWSRWYDGAKRCFTIEPQDGRWVKLTNAATGLSHRATLAPTSGE